MDLCHGKKQGGFGSDGGFIVLCSENWRPNQSGSPGWAVAVEILLPLQFNWQFARSASWKELLSRFDPVTLQAIGQSPRCYVLGCIFETSQDKDVFSLGAD